MTERKKDVAHPKREEELLDYWDERNIFEKSVDERPDDKPYVFYDGPPFATGLPHYGHILSSVIKDVVPRYWTMRGYQVRRRWGWDCHGLPIEQLVEKELEISGKKDIEDMGVEKFNDTCCSKVLTYTDEWGKMVRRIARWIEFDNSYKTMDATYMESVWWALKTIWDKGLIYEGRKVLLYCPRCETPVSKAEVAMDNSYKDVTEEAVTVKFKIKNDKLKKFTTYHLLPNTYLLAWTTTPWTLPGNVGLAVGKDIEYVMVKYAGEYLIVAKALLEKVFAGKTYEVVQEVKGKDLLDLDYEPFYTIEEVKNSDKRAWYVTDADFVTTDEGTGVVHTAAIYGEDDYQLALEKGIPSVPLLDDRGHFNDDAPAFVRGEYFKKAETAITKDLEERGLLFAKNQNTHSYPHCWRCDTPLIYNAISAWFINIQKVKPKLIALNEQINWYPDYLKHGRFQNILETAPDWNISRNRYWATPLPFWKCEKEACDGVVCIGSVAELKERASNFNEVYHTDKVEEIDLHKDKADSITLRCEKCDGTMRRIPEVIDCWVESASMPFAEFHYPFENKAVVKERLHGEGGFIAEYISQTRAWFYYMHALSVLLEEDYEHEPGFKNCVTTGVILTENGEKMSKSKRNFPDPWRIIEKYGVDALRFYLMQSSVMKADDLNFSEKELDEVYKKVILILRNVLNFWKMYGGKSEAKQSSDVSGQLPHVLDTWIVARLEKFAREVGELMERYAVADATRLIAPFVDDLSTWYVRRSRDRFKTDGEDKRRAVAVLASVLATTAKVIAPVMPFLAEHIYLAVDGGKESVHLEMWPLVKDAEKEDIGVLEDMEKVRKIVEVVHSIRKEKGIRLRQPLRDVVLQSAGWRHSTLSDQYKALVMDEVNVLAGFFNQEGKAMLWSEGGADGEKYEKRVVDGQIIVYLNTALDDELRAEGIANDFMRLVSVARKNARLTIDDVADAVYATDGKIVADAIAQHKERIMKATGLSSLQKSEMGDGEEGKIEGREVQIKIIVVGM